MDNSVHLCTLMYIYRIILKIDIVFLDIIAWISIDVFHKNNLHKDITIFGARVFK